ncbi:MAG: hypothetical protein R3C13_05305 [Hyphomonas sp.]|uniref:hypothetical protein n=1 Tax=Hyphomonas sp. TaxID=87 RepID=UPI0035295C35
MPDEIQVNQPGRRINIQLNPNGVVAPAMNAVKTTLGVISRLLPTIEEGPLPDTIAVELEGLSLRLADHGDQNERRTRQKNWLLAKGFHELARGIRLSLEEACLYNTTVQMREQVVRDEQHLVEILNAVKTAVNRLNFPDLLAQVNDGLQTELMWYPQFLSFQKVRNCLEHRDGLVSQDKDVEQGVDALVLSVPKLQLFLKMGEREVELVPGMVAEEEATVLLKSGTKEISFPVGSRISFSAQDFSQMAFGTWQMVSELAGKLPVPD